MLKSEVDMPSEDNKTKKRKITTLKETLDTKRKGKKKFLMIEDLTLRQLCSFNHSRRFLQSNPEIADVIYRIVEKKKKKPCSLRVLEHLVTKFSRYYDIRLNKDGEVDEFGEFYVADEYYKHLPKDDADPCRRGPLIEYKYGDKILTTTIPQMCSTISICTAPTIKYAEENYLVILHHLNLKKGIKAKKKKKSNIKLPVKVKKPIYQIIPGNVTITF